MDTTTESPVLPAEPPQEIDTPLERASVGVMEGEPRQRFEPLREPPETAENAHRPEIAVITQGVTWGLIAGIVLTILGFGSS
ncbi:MAG: hypothetical protein ABR529_08385 [Actinomycetota bacterium]